MAARIVVTEFVSLDGVMEAPGGEPGFKYPGWSFEFDRGDDGNQFKLDETRGRVRRQVQRDAEVRRLDDAQGPGVEQHDGPRQRRRDGPGAQAEGGIRRRAASAREPPTGAGADRERPRRPDQPDGLPGDPRDWQEGIRGEVRATQPEAEGVEGRRRRRARADLRAGRRSQVATGQYHSKTRTKESYGRGRPQGEAGAVPGADRRVDDRDDPPDGRRHGGSRAGHLRVALRCGWVRPRWFAGSVRELGQTNAGRPSSVEF